jgi:hypothetical protein
MLYSKQNTIHVYRSQTNFLPDGNNVGTNSFCGITGLVRNLPAELNGDNAEANAHPVTHLNSQNHTWKFTKELKRLRYGDLKIPFGLYSGNRPYGLQSQLSVIS